MYACRYFFHDNQYGLVGLYGKSDIGTKYLNPVTPVLNQLTNLYFIALLQLVTLHYMLRGVTEHRREHPVNPYTSCVMTFVTRYTVSFIERSVDLSRDVRKPDFCICENKDADQLRGNREADQRLCFRYTDSTIPLLSKSEICSI